MITMIAHDTREYFLLLSIIYNHDNHRLLFIMFMLTRVITLSHSFYVLLMDLIQLEMLLVCLS